MENYKSMVFYQSWYEIAKGNGEKFLNKAVIQLLEYGLYKTVPDNSDDPIMKMFFDMAKPNIDRNIQNRENGRRGGRPRTRKTLKTDGLSNVDADADVNADADADTDVDKASPAPSTSGLEGQVSGDEISPEEAREALERYEREHGYRL